MHKFGDYELTKSLLLDKKGVLEMGFIEQLQINFKKLFDPYKGLPREIYIIFISKIVNAAGCLVMPLMTLILTQKVGLDKQTSGMFITLAGILYMPTGFLGGKVADTIGRKKVIIIFNSLCSILYIVCGFMEPSIKMVYVFMVAGALGSFAGPALDALIGDLTEPSNRNAAYALGYMGWNIGFAVGPIIGGLLFKNHLRWVFIGDALTAFISLGLIAVFVKETLYLTKKDITDESRKMEKREEGSILHVLLKRPILLYFAIIIFGYNFVYSQWSFMMPIHISQIYGELGAEYYGYLASMNGLIVMIFTPFVTKLSEHNSDIKNMFHGGLYYAIGFGMLGFLHTLPFFFVSVFIFTIGEIVLSISTTPFIMNHTPISHRGRMSGFLPMIMGLGYVFSPMIMGKVLMNVNIEICWMILGGIVLISSLLMKRLEKFE